MEKLKKIPRNRVEKVQMEAYMESPMYCDYGSGDYYGRERKFQPNLRAKIEISIDIRELGDEEFVRGIQAGGLEFVANLGLNIEKFRYVINQGMIKLPALLRHPDPEIAQLAWILSKYFAQRNDIMPEQVIE